MPAPNFNPDATNNPLLKLLAGRNIWGNSGVMFNEGFSPGTTEDGTSLAQFSGNTDRSKYMAFNPNAGMGGGDEGLSGAWQMKPEYQSKFIRNGQNWTQLNNLGVGGDLQVIDPSKVQWDDEFGMMTPATNIKPDKGAEYGDLALYVIGSAIMGGVTGAAAASTGSTTTSTLGSTGSSLLDSGINTLTSPQNLYRLGATALKNTGPTATTGKTMPGTSSIFRDPQTGGVVNGMTGTDPNGVNALFSDDGAGSGAGGWLGQFLGLLGLGHSAYGNGIGTANGAIDAGNKGAALADPWGASGRRAAFNDILSPEKVMSLLSQDPSAVLNNPAYKFDLEQGTNAINMGDAAQGTLRSGNRGYELQAYGQGLASKYGQQMFQNNLSTLGALSGLAGVGASSPTAAAQATTSAWDNASNIRNASQNGLFKGGSQNGMNAIGGILGLLGKGGSAAWNWLTSGSGDLSQLDPELAGMFQSAADNAGMTVDEYIASFDGTQLIPDFEINDPDFDWASIFGEGDYNLAGIFG